MSKRMGSQSDTFSAMFAVWLDFDDLTFAYFTNDIHLNSRRLAMACTSASVPKEVLPTKSEIAKCKLANTDLPEY
jgi:hypothetical protein